VADLDQNFTLLGLRDIDILDNQRLACLFKDGCLALFWDRGRHVVEGGYLMRVSINDAKQIYEQQA